MQTDRQTVEMIFPSFLVAQFALSIYQQDGDDPEVAAMYRRVMAHLSPELTGYQPRPPESSKIQRRAKREAKNAERVLDGEPFPAAVLAVKNFLQSILDEGHLEMIPGGNFEKAWETLTDLIEKQDKAGALAASGIEQRASYLAGEMRRTIGKNNLFVG